MLKCLFAIPVFGAATLAVHISLPSNYRTVIDNRDVLVQQVHYGAHETVPMHDHPEVATVYVYLNDDKGFTILHEGWEKPVHRPPAKAGAFRVSPGNLERHAIENSSDTPSDFVRIELKNIPVHTLPGEFRGQAAPPPADPGAMTMENATVAYSIPQLSVERVYRQGGLPIPAEPHPSVMVEIPKPSDDPQKMQLIHWIPAGQTYKPENPAPAQFLRIVLKQPAHETSM